MLSLIYLEALKADSLDNGRASLPAKSSIIFGGIDR